MESIFYTPIVNLFLFLYKSLGENFVLAIVLVTLILQLVLWPLSIKQYTASKKMKAHQDKLKAVQDKKNAGKELNMEEMQMASQAFKGMCAGCLPSLIQLPFLIGIFNMFSSIAKDPGNGTIFNHLAYSNYLKFPEGYAFHLNFFGLDLSKTFFTVGFNNIGPLIVLILIIAATFFAQYYSMKLTTPAMSKDKNVQEIDATTDKNKKKKKEEELKNPLDREIAASPDQMMKIFTGFILVISITSAAALSIYWLARSIFVIILTKVQLKYIIKDK